MQNRKRIEYATETEDKAGLALTELWALLTRIFEEVPRVAEMMAVYPDRMITMKEQLWDLIQEVQTGLELQPAYRLWAGAVLDLCSGRTFNDLPFKTQRLILDQGEPMHLQAVNRMLKESNLLRERFGLANAVAQAAAGFVMEVESAPKSPLEGRALNQRLIELLDRHLGHGNSAFTAWQHLRSQVAAAKLREHGHE